MSIKVWHTKIKGDQQWCPCCETWQLLDQFPTWTKSERRIECDYKHRHGQVGCWSRSKGTDHWTIVQQVCEHKRVFQAPQTPANKFLKQPTFYPEIPTWRSELRDGGCGFRR